MNVLVTAGNTLVPIDRVRGITNIFTGRTGAAIALCANARGHDVRLATSHPEVVGSLCGDGVAPAGRWALDSYRTFDDLQGLMGSLLGGTSFFDAVVHCAAVSDYRPVGVYAAAPGTRFNPTTSAWQGDAPALVDRSAGKVKSDEDELWMRLVRTPKLVDLVREKWGFRGVLVKFKLEVGVSEKRLREIAEHSRQQSSADLMVANTLEGAAKWALLGPVGNGYERVGREDLAPRLMEEVERLHAERGHG